MTHKSKSIRRLFGILKYEGPPVTLEEMEDAIASGACEVPTTPEADLSPPHTPHNPAPRTPRT